MKRAELANDIVVAKLEITGLAFELHILRLTANHGVLKDAITGSDARESLNDGIGADLAIWANFDVILDDGCGMDGHF